MKDCINPAAYWQCISLNQGKCLHDGPCDPINAEGDRFRARQIREVVDADKANEALRIAAILKEKKRRGLTVTEGPGPVPKPAPHQWLEPFMKDVDAACEHVLQDSRRLQQEVR